jgi:hypothetical protein
MTPLLCRLYVANSAADKLTAAKLHQLKAMTHMSKAETFRKVAAIMRCHRVRLTVIRAAYKQAI